MKIVVASVFTLLLATGPVLAQSKDATTQSKPSEESVRRLLEVMQAKNLVEAAAEQVGHAVIVKLPLAMKTSMSDMQERMRQMIPKIQQLAKETAEQLNSQTPPAQKKNAG